MKIIMITKLDLSFSTKDIVTQESLLKINFFHLSSKEQSLHSPSSGSSRLTQNVLDDDFAKILRKYHSKNSIFISCK